MTTSSKASLESGPERLPRNGEVETLLHRLRRAPASSLQSLVDEHGRDFSVRELRQILLNPFVDGEVLQTLAANRKLMSMHEAKAAVARHRRTPEPVAMRLIPNLFWRDLTEITLDLRIRASVRRVAERYLVQRLPRLTQGEKLNLARRSADSVAAILISEQIPRVTEAALDNPRLTESALLEIVASAKSTPHLLATIANHTRWGTRYEVRAALCQNARTPYQVTLRHLESLRSDELESIVGNEDHADFLRAMARELRSIRARAGSIGLESESREESESFSIPGDESNTDSPPIRKTASRDPLGSEKTIREAVSSWTYEEEKA